MTMSEVKEKEKKVPLCGKCRNHGVSVPLKGHKKDCARKTCTCRDCILGVERRNVNKEINEVKKMIGGVAPKKIILYSPDSTPLSPVSTVSANSLPASPPEELTPFIDRLGELAEDTDRLLNNFDLQGEATAFVYALLYVAGSYESAVQIIQKEMTPFRDDRSIRSSSFDGDRSISSSNEVCQYEPRGGAVLGGRGMVYSPPQHPGVIRSPINSNGVLYADNTPNIVYPRIKKRYNYNP